MLALSRDNNDPDHQLHALWGLWAARIGEGALRTALALAEEFSSLAQQTSEIDRCVGDRMLGHSLHLLGDQAPAREHLERMLAKYAPPATAGAQAMRYIFDQRALARCFLARISWLQGYPDQAMKIACDVTNDERASCPVVEVIRPAAQGYCSIDVCALRRRDQMALRLCGRVRAPTPTELHHSRVHSEDAIRSASGAEGSPASLNVRPPETPWRALFWRKLDRAISGRDAPVSRLISAPARSSQRQLGKTESRSVGFDWCPNTPFE